MQINDNYWCNDKKISVTELTNNQVVARVDYCYCSLAQSKVAQDKESIKYWKKEKFKINKEYNKRYGKS